MSALKTAEQTASTAKLKKEQAVLLKIAETLEPLSTEQRTRILGSVAIFYGLK